MQKLVSVIIPTYNSAKYIKEALESVFHQSYANCEIIVIDDGSTDDTREVLKQYLDRIVYIYKENGGPASARNKGLEVAKGGYIAFLDADDLWFPEKIACQVAKMQNDPDVGISFCSFQVINSNSCCNGKRVGSKNKRIGSRIYDKLLRGNFIVASSVMIRRSVVEKVGYFDPAGALKFVEDFDFWLRITRNYKALYLPEIFGCYRIHQENSSVNDVSRLKVLKVLDKQLEFGTVSQKQINQAKADCYFHEGWYFIDKNPHHARECLKKAIRLCSGNFMIMMRSLGVLIFSYDPFKSFQILKNV